MEVIMYVGVAQDYSFVTLQMAAVVERWERDWN